MFIVIVPHAWNVNCDERDHKRLLLVYNKTLAKVESNKIQHMQTVHTLELKK